MTNQPNRNASWSTLVYIGILVCKAQKSSANGDKERKLDLCRNLDECVWRHTGKVFYNVDESERTERDLYYTESYKIKAHGKITFKISESKRVYFYRSQYSNDVIYKIFQYGGQLETTPIFVNGKMKNSKFYSVHEKSYTSLNRGHFRKLDSEYTCEGYGRLDEKTCTVEVYLMTFQMPFQARALNKNETCECIENGTYTVTNIPDVILTTESERII